MACGGGAALKTLLGFNVSRVKGAQRPQPAQGEENRRLAGAAPDRAVAGEGLKVLGQNKKSNCFQKKKKKVLGQIKAGFYVGSGPGPPPCPHSQNGGSRPSRSVNHEMQTSRAWTPPGPPF